jgi:hypothetical protein
VHGREPLTDLDAVVDSLGNRHGPAVQPLAERLSLQQFEDGVVDAILGADIVQGEHVRVAEAGDDTCLLLETLQSVGIAPTATGQNLDRDRAAEAGIDGAVYLAHASRTQGGIDSIRA